MLVCGSSVADPWLNSAESSAVGGHRNPPARDVCWILVADSLSLLLNGASLLLLPVEPFVTLLGDRS